MRLFTSNSKTGQWPLTQLGLLCAGSATFLLCLLLGMAAWRLVPERIRHEHVPISGVSRPADPNYYLAYYRGDSVQHYVHYFATSPTVNQRLPAAQVLFLGSSRALYAFPQETLKPFFESRGISYYVLAFLYGETSPLPLSIIQRQNLHPKWVIANCDAFFSHQPSDYARDVMRHNSINAHELEMEANLTFDLTRVLHQFLPHLKLLQTRRGEEISFRSAEDGTIVALATNWRPTAIKAAPGQATSLSSGDLQAAREFKAEVERRGGQLILTYVPTPESSPAEAEAMAKRLGVVLLSPAVKGLNTIDGSHLDKASAARFSQAVLQQFSDVVLKPSAPR